MTEAPRSVRVLNMITPQVREVFADVLQHLEAVHVRHFDVEGQQVRSVLRNALEPDGAVRSRAHNLDRRIRLERPGHELANDYRVIHDHDPDTFAGLQGPLVD